MALYGLMLSFDSVQFVNGTITGNLKWSSNISLGGIGGITIAYSDGTPSSVIDFPWGPLSGTVPFTHVSTITPVTINASINGVTGTNITTIVTNQIAVNYIFKITGKDGTVLNNQVLAISDYTLASAASQSYGAIMSGNVLTLNSPNTSVNSLITFAAAHAGNNPISFSGNTPPSTGSNPVSNAVTSSSGPPNIISGLKAGLFGGLVLMILKSGSVFRGKK